MKYWDGQFDDARLAVTIARTAASRGALLVNYCGVTGLLHADNKVSGLQCRDAETGRSFDVRARCVVNAAGVWAGVLPLELRPGAPVDDARLEGSIEPPDYITNYKRTR